MAGIFLTKTGQKSGWPTPQAPICCGSTYAFYMRKGAAESPGKWRQSPGSPLRVCCRCDIAPYNGGLNFVYLSSLPPFGSFRRRSGKMEVKPNQTSAARPHANGGKVKTRGTGLFLLTPQPAQWKKAGFSGCYNLYDIGSACFLLCGFSFGLCLFFCFALHAVKLQKMAVCLPKSQCRRIPNISTHCIA